jgi:hypothetical protein
MRKTRALFGISALMSLVSSCVLGILRLSAMRPGNAVSRSQAPKLQKMVVASPDLNPASSRILNAGRTAHALRRDDREPQPNLPAPADGQGSNRECVLPARWWAQLVGAP